MEIITHLPIPPEEITDRGLLERALSSLQERKRVDGREYVFEYMQQPMVGGTCRLVPVTESPRSIYTRILRVYDTHYFEQRLANER